MRKKKFLKNTLLLCICVSLLCTFSVAQAFAASSLNDIRVFVNGAWVEFDQKPIIEKGRTLVPFRAIGEALGCDVWYDAAEKAVWFVFDCKIYTMKIGDKVITGYEVIEQTEEWYEYDSNAFISYPLEVPAKIVNGRTMVPVRAIAEILECNVEWYGSIRTIDIDQLERQLFFKIDKNNSIFPENSHFTSKNPIGLIFSEERYGPSRVDILYSDYDTFTNTTDLGDVWDEVPVDIPYYNKFLKGEFYLPISHMLPDFGANNFAFVNFSEDQSKMIYAYVPNVKYNMETECYEGEEAYLPDSFYAIYCTEDADGELEWKYYAKRIADLKERGDFIIQREIDQYQSK